MLAHTGPAFIAVSFHRLFLGGSLPSRARFRFAGLLAYTSLHEADARAVSRGTAPCVQNAVGLRNRSSCKSSGSGLRDSW